MRHNKVHKKDTSPKRKDRIEERFHHGRPTNDKVKYRHKNHWLDEEEADIIHVKKKKKSKG